MNTAPLYKESIRYLIFYCISVGLTRYLGGVAIGGLIVFALFCIMNRKLADGIATLVIVTFMIECNHLIVPLSTYGCGVALRFGVMVVSIALALRGRSRLGGLRLPLGMIVPYLAVSCISSVTGYAPLASYLKIVQFIVFISGIWYGVQNLDKDYGQLLRLRATFLALAAFVIIGSAVLIPFPGISTLNGMQTAMLTKDIEEVNLQMKEMLATDPDAMQPLFCGITAQSQVMAPLGGCLFAWLLFDMLVVERRFRKLYLLLMSIDLVLIRMTSSRSGFVTLLTAMLFAYAYLPKHITLPLSVKSRLNQGMAIALVFLFAIIAVSEVRHSGLTSWIRKTGDVKSDKRSFFEAFTSSRQGLVDKSWDDFRKNPIFGMGFQVNEDSPKHVQKAKFLPLSVPIEKGVTPVMILGESGIVGTIVFIAFLCSFYSECRRKRFYVTIAMFTVMFATNMGEATFFSVGGLGGNLWLLCVMGGFIVDSYQKIFDRDIQFFA